MIKQSTITQKPQIANYKQSHQAKRTFLLLTAVVLFNRMLSTYFVFPLKTFYLQGSHSSHNSLFLYQTTTEGRNTSNMIKHSQQNTVHIRLPLH